MKWLDDSRNIQKPIGILMFVVYRAHQGSSRREHFIDEDEDGLLGRKLDAFADDIYELAYGQIGWDQVLLLVDGCDI